MKKIIIYGAGSVGRMIEQIIFDINNKENQWDLLGYIDDNVALHNTTYFGLNILGGLEVIENYDDTYIIISFSNPVTRKKAVSKLFNVHFPVLIHPSAVISRRVTIGEGAVIYPGVVIDVDVSIGSHIIINKNCTIGHDSEIANFVTLSPGVNLGGNLVIEEGVEFGINSSSIQGLHFGKWSKIGGGAAVVKNIPENCVAVGIPAKPIIK